MVASFTVAGDVFRAETPRVWSSVRYTVRGLTRMFDLHPSGDRIAMAPVTDMSDTGASERVIATFNFFDELRRLAPPSK